MNNLLTDICGRPLQIGQKVIWAAQGSRVYEAEITRITAKQLYIKYKGISWSGRPFSREARISISRCADPHTPGRVVRIYAVE